MNSASMEAWAWSHSIQAGELKASPTECHSKAVQCHHPWTLTTWRYRTSLLCRLVTGDSEYMVAEELSRPKTRMRRSGICPLQHWLPLLWAGHAPWESWTILRSPVWRTSTSIVSLIQHRIWISMRHGERWSGRESLSKRSFHTYVMGTLVRPIDLVTISPTPMSATSCIHCKRSRRAQGLQTCKQGRRCTARARLEHRMTLSLLELRSISSLRSSQLLRTRKSCQIFLVTTALTLKKKWRLSSRAS